MKKMFLSAVTAVAMMGFLAACSSAPKGNTTATPAQVSEAKAWLGRYCSKVNPASELVGSLIMKARTMEFKGQYPATVHFDRSGAFQLEITNILGGTLVQLLGDQPGESQSLEIKSPTKPRYNRKGITHYLGLEVSVLTQLLHGDLPCPAGALNAGKAEGTKVVIETANWRWIFDRGATADQEVPMRVQLLPVTGPVEGKSIEMQIEDWDQTANYAKKVYLKTPEGELHWSWRDREFR